MLFILLFVVCYEDKTGSVNNLSRHINCTHVEFCWDLQFPQELKVFTYFYQLTLKQSVVDTSTTDGLCVIYDLAASILEPNVDGYEFSVWPNEMEAKEVRSIAAAFGMYGY